ncbi:hypothetical protein FS837_001807, partial [Tulasnella sp. UAMH 9824]
ALVSPDMALLLVPSDEAPLKPLAWMDIKIPTEVKLDSDNPILQIARYTRCIKQEQQDRKFIHLHEDHLSSGLLGSFGLLHYSGNPLSGYGSIDMHQAD